MSDTRLTDERLRTFLDANQVQRERLCCAILPLLGNYESVRPRRPKGGPDGARDLVATIAGGVTVWGAVGFKNQVSDSPEDKAWAKKKFRDDINAARDENVGLEAFVFLTNIDLTPGEVQKLKTQAESLGFTSVDVFYREELRRALDSTLGAPYRLQYLDIPMSREEQVAFFESFGRDLHHVLQQQHQSVDEKLKAVDFRIASMRLVKDFRVSFELDNEYFPAELDAFFVYAGISGPKSPDGFNDLSIGGYDVREKPFVDQRTGRTVNLWAVKTVVWNPRSPAPPRVHDPKMRSERLKTVDIYTSLAAIGHVDQLSDLQDCHLSVCASPSICSKLQRVIVEANGWRLFEQSRGALTFGNERDIAWPRSTAQPAGKVRVRGIEFSTEDPYRACKGAWHIDFEKVTPSRAHAAKPTH